MHFTEEKQQQQQQIDLLFRQVDREIGFCKQQGLQYLSLRGGALLSPKYYNSSARYLWQFSGIINYSSAKNIPGHTWIYKTDAAPEASPCWLCHQSCWRVGMAACLDFASEGFNLMPYRESWDQTSSSAAWETGALCSKAPPVLFYSAMWKCLCMHHTDSTNVHTRCSWLFRDSSAVQCLPCRKSAVLWMASRHWLR